MQTQNATRAIVLNTDSHRDSTFIQTAAPNGKSIWPSHQTSTHSTMETSTVMSSTAISAAILDAGGYIEFSLPKLNRKIDTLTLEVTLTGGDSLVGIRQAFLMVDKVEYFAGSSFLGSSDWMSSYLHHCLMNSDEMILAKSRHTNTGADFQVQTQSLQADEERVFYIPVTGMLQGLCPGLLNESLRLRVHFSKDLFTVKLPTQAAPSVTKCHLLMEAVSMTPGEVSELASVYQSNKFTHRYHEPRVQRVNVTMNPAQNFTVSLQNFYGSFSQIWVAIISASVDPIYATTFIDELKSLHITTSDSKIAMGGSILQGSWVQYAHADSFPSSFLHNHAVYPLCASKHPFVGLAQGSHNGSLDLTARGETLHILSPSTAVPSTPRKILIVGWHVSALRVQNGNIVALR